MSSTIRTFIVLFVATLTLMSLPVHGQPPVPTVESWLAQRHAQLSAIKEPSKARPGDLGQGDKPNLNNLYLVGPKQGFIQFEDDSWILLSSLSVHNGPFDISLIRTSEGGYFINHGHCCPQIVLTSKEKITNLDGFLKTTAKGPRGGVTTWEKYKAP